LNLINEGKDAIMKFNLDSKFRYDLPFFTQDEIKGFIKKYMGEKIFPNGLTIAEYEELVSNFILKATGGHPIAIMIKFYLLGGGLHTDVERRYNDYLIDDSRKIRIMLVPITDAFLEKTGLLKEAYNLEHATLYSSEGFWKTLHPRWDEEFLSFLYSETKGGRLYNNKRYLRDALDSIFNLTEDKISVTQQRAYLLIGAIYDIAARRVMPINVIEEVTNIPNYITDEEKTELYTYYIAMAYSALENFQIAIDKLNEALTYRPNFVPALALLRNYVRCKSHGLAVIHICMRRFNILLH
jgi:tetratricopeptide (TPR) repeat protein